MKNLLKSSAMAAAIMAGLGAAPAWADNLVLWVNAPLASGADAPLYAELKAFEEKTGHTVEVQAVPHMEMERNRSRSGAYPVPFFWSPLILIGDGQ